jgi:release factor glutamine methyltransferase
MAERHTGPWPARNDERSVTQWLEAWIGGEEATGVVRLLLRHVTGKDRGLRLMGHAYSESELNRLADCARACSEGKPVQHVLGQTLFHGLELKTDDRALIPRPETEELAAWVLTWMRTHRVARVCDAGTGTGCLALALKAGCPGADVVALDASSTALELARENGKRLGLQVSWHCLRFEELSELSNPPFDAVVSNPPYIPDAERSEMDAVVVEHDPHEALFVPDETPLVHYRTLVDQCTSGDALRPGGLLAFEVHEAFADEVAGLLVGWHHVEIHHDLQAKPRMVTAQRP